MEDDRKYRIRTKHELKRLIRGADIVRFIKSQCETTCCVQHRLQACVDIRLTAWTKQLYTKFRLSLIHI